MYAAKNFGLSRAPECLQSLMTLDVYAAQRILRNRDLLPFFGDAGNKAVVRIPVPRLGLEARDVDGKTALTYAADGGHGENTALLTEQGAAVGANDNFGKTALMYAAAEGNQLSMK